MIGAEPGGLLNESANVENWPGDTSVPGRELMRRFKEHVESLGVEVKQEWVKEATKTEAGFTLATDKDEYAAKALVLTMGSKHRHLGVKGEDTFSGKGVSYCPTCDAAFFKNVPVAVIGGGDGAASAANMLAEHASHVYVLVRKDHMRAEPINKQKLERNEKIDILYETEAVEFCGDNLLTGIRLSTPHDGDDLLKVEGAFVMIGSDPQTQLAEQLGVELNEGREMVIDEESRTNVPFVYAAGDAANKKHKQTITGAAEGVKAAFSAYEDIRKAETGEKPRLPEY